jgi:hypothetical protein
MKKREDTNEILKDIRTILILLAKQNKALLSRLEQENRIET